MRYSMDVKGDGVTGSVSREEVLTIIPTLKELGALFGLGQIIWFVWLGAVMLRGTTNATGH